MNRSRWPASRLKPGTRIGLWRGANNMPGGWMQWTFEQYGFNHQIVSSLDFEGDLAAKSRHDRPAGGHQPRHDRQWPRCSAERQDRLNGPTVSARPAGRSWPSGCATAARSSRPADSVETARLLLDLPIAKVLPEAARGGVAVGRTGAGGGAGASARGCDERVEGDLHESRAAGRDAARARHRAGSVVLLPGLAARRTTSTRIIRSATGCRHPGRCSSNPIRPTA